MAEHVRRPLRPERLGHARRGDHSAEREVAGGDPLRDRDQVGREPEPLGREPRPRAPEAGDHLVEDQQHLTFAADLLHALEVALGRDHDAAGADHRLREEGTGVVGADAVDRLRERLGIVPRNLVDLGDEPPVALDERLQPAEGRAVRVRAVVGELPREDHVLVGLPDRRPVGAGELRGGVDRLAAAGGEEDLGAVEREQPRYARSELLGLRRRETVVGLVGRELAHLRRGRVGQLCPPVADVAVPERGGDVEQGVSGVVPDRRALAAHDRDPALAERAHVRHRIPERALRHWAMLAGCRDRCRGGWRRRRRIPRSRRWRATPRRTSRSSAAATPGSGRPSP